MSKKNGPGRGVRAGLGAGQGMGQGTQEGRSALPQMDVPQGLMGPPGRGPSRQGQRGVHQEEPLGPVLSGEDWRGTGLEKVGQRQQKTGSWTL